MSIQKYDANEETRLVSEIAAKEELRQDYTKRMYDTLGRDPEAKGMTDEPKVLDSNEMMAYKSLELNEQMVSREIKDMKAKLDAMRVTKPVEVNPKKDPSPKNALTRWVLEGENGLLQEELDHQREMSRQFGPVNGGNRRFVDPIFNVIDAPDQDTDGGRLTQDTTIQGVVDGLTDFGGILNMATIARTMNGNAIKYPVADDGTTKGDLKDSLTDATDEKPLPAFEVQTLEAFPVDTGFTQVSRYFNEDVNWDIGAYVRRTMQRRIGREIEFQATRGTGAAGNPNGFQNVATTVNKSDDDAATIDWRDLVTLIHSVDPAWLRGEQGLYGFMHQPGKVGFLASWIFIGELRKIQDSQNRPLVLPDLRMDMGLTLMGYPLNVCQDLQYTSFSGANATPIYFGNFGYFAIRFAGSGIAIEQFYDSGTAKENFDLYLGRVRMDSDVISPVTSGKTASIKALRRDS